MLRRYFGVFVYAVVAGFCIGLGGTVYLALFDTCRPLGAVLFTVGLFTICTMGFHLFTGKACYIFDNKPAYLIDLVVIWVGNLVGAWIIGSIIRTTRLLDAYSAAAMSLCTTKLADSYLSLFLLGLVCNALIYIAVESYKNNPHEVGKYLGLIFGVTVFILAGTEHSVADMYYFAAAGTLFQPQSLLCIVMVSLGNVVGGLLLPLGKKLKAWCDRPAAVV